MVTNSTFTPAARELARVNGVRLIDGDKLNGLLDHIEMYQDCEPLVDDFLAWSGFSELPPAGMRPAVSQSAGVVEVFDRPDVVASTARMPSVEPAEWRGSRSSSGARAAQAPKTSRVPRTYNLSEVAVRWGCSQGAVKKHISSGLPMYKMPNGRWAVTEGDLLGYERMLAEREERERRRGRLFPLL